MPKTSAKSKRGDASAEPSEPVERQRRKKVTIAGDGAGTAADESSSSGRHKRTPTDAAAVDPASADSAPAERSGGKRKKKRAEREHANAGSRSDKRPSEPLDPVTPSGSNEKRSSAVNVVKMLDQKNKRRSGLFTQVRAINAGQRSAQWWFERDRGRKECTDDGVVVFFLIFFF